MGVRAVLAVLLLFIATVKAAEGGVTFWKKEFTMICPQEGIWYKDQQISSSSRTHTVMYESDKKGPYYCAFNKSEEHINIKYYFYVQAKVCENCYELDGILFLMAIAADVVGTAMVMMIIYRCTKKKSSTGLTQASKPPARQGGRAPPVPSPDYEQLNPRTISQDAYSVVNRMG